MGLDMWLMEIKNVDELTDCMFPDAVPRVIMGNKLFEMDKDAQTEDVCYWRKANQIHYFFERELTITGIEDCWFYEVPKHVFEKLYAVCNKVMEIGNKAKERDYKLEDYEIEMINAILPTRDGFFFGSTEYNEFYFIDVEDTIQYVGDILATMERNPNYTVWYYAWW